MTKAKQIGILLILCFIASCDTVYFNPIPYAPVNFKIYLSGEDIDLVGSTKSKLFVKPRSVGESVGFGGLLVYNVEGSGSDLFYVYDLTCPHEANRSIKVAVVETIYAKCPTCGSKFEIYSGIGNPISGPSKYSLKRYTGISISGNIVTIYN
jgi:nitrite reductase/ring-hydroxylating ferredoxin subunit